MDMMRPRQMNLDGSELERDLTVSENCSAKSELEVKMLLGALMGDGPRGNSLVSMK